MTEYHITLFWSDADDAWGGRRPDLRQCSALRSTPAEAPAEVLTAEQAWLESAVEHGDPIPDARYRPAIYAAGVKGATR